MQTHSPAEWAEALLLGTGIYVAASAVYFLLVDADPSDFDPRPLARRTATVVHQGVVHAGHDLNRAIAHAQRTARAVRADAAWTVAALLILTIPTGDNR